MPLVRVGALLACAAAVSLCGCVGSGFSEQAAGGVSLDGNWKLDHAASDDPQKVLAHMREQATVLIKRHQDEVAARTGMTPTEIPEGPPPGAGGHGGGQHDPLRHSPMADVIRTMLERGDFLTVHQSPTEFVLDYGTVRRSFRPGGHSVVSAEGGVGDQNSGWHGREFRIEVKPQMGPVVTETYQLSPDGKQLLETLKIATAELPGVTIKRVYNPTTEAAPRQLPVND